MQQYIKPVEAIRLTVENIESVVTWMSGLSELRKDYKGRYILVAIMNEWHSAGVGQWVVKDSNGNYQVVNDADFNKLYEPSPAKAEQEGRDHYRDIKKDGYPPMHEVVEVWIEENEMPFQATWRDDGLGPCWHSENYEVQENKDNIRYWRPIRIDGPGATPSPTRAVQDGPWKVVSHHEASAPAKDGEINEAMIDAIYEGAELWRQEYDDCRKILKELVDLKMVKEFEGKTEEYKERQPLAWMAAIEFLNVYQHLGE